MDHSPFPVLIGLIIFTVALAAAVAAISAPQYMWMLLVLTGIAVFVYATGPLIVMGRLVRADRLHTGWALIAVFMQALLWSCIWWVITVAFKVAIDTGSLSLETAKQFNPAELKLDHSTWYALGGFVVYTLVNAVVYNAVLMATYLRGILISIGTDLLRIVLVGLWAFLLGVFE